MKPRLPSRADAARFIVLLIRTQIGKINKYWRPCLLLHIFYASISS